jgi:hypothetical protein
LEAASPRIGKAQRMTGGLNEDANAPAGGAADAADTIDEMRRAHRETVKARRESACRREIDWAWKEGAQ